MGAVAADWPGLVLDHTWEMQDRDLTDDASAG